MSLLFWCAYIETILFKNERDSHYAICLVYYQWEQQKESYALSVLLENVFVEITYEKRVCTNKQNISRNSFLCPDCGNFRETLENASEDWAERIGQAATGYGQFQKDISVKLCWNSAQDLYEWWWTKNMQKQSMRLLPDAILFQRTLATKRARDLFSLCWKYWKIILGRIAETNCWFSC